MAALDANLRSGFVAAGRAGVARGGSDNAHPFPQIAFWQLSRRFIAGDAMV
jgi:hypothetical protein